MLNIEQQYLSYALWAIMKMLSLNDQRAPMLSAVTIGILAFFLRMFCFSLYLDVGPIRYDQELMRCGFCLYLYGNVCREQSQFPRNREEKLILLFGEQVVSQWRASAR
jgi:hypothetical protein